MATFTSSADMSRATLDSYMKLPMKGAIQAEYIWIGGSGSDIRCKTKTLPASSLRPAVMGEKRVRLADLPKWNFDGSSTGQAPGADSEVILVPKAIYPDPFRLGENILVLCDLERPDGTVLETNTRRAAEKVFSEDLDAMPWYGLEQEYTLFNTDGSTPLGWPKGGYPSPQGPYYCSVGAENSFGRYIVEAHYRACLYAELSISGVNAEVMAGQWEYQIGPVEGIAAGDQLWVSRYIMARVCEEFGIQVSFDPKPMPGDWNGAGCHANFSTAAMREEGGYEVIIGAIKHLAEKHAEHIACYGEGNERRLTGLHETASITKFSYGVADRGASIRIPRETEAKGYGYLEDRRPASNCDPYAVTSMIFATAHLDGAASGASSGAGSSTGTACSS